MYRSCFFVSGAPAGNNATAATDPFALSVSEAGNALENAALGAVGLRLTRTLAQQLAPDAHPPWPGLIELTFDHPALALASRFNSDALQPLLKPGFVPGPVVVGRERVVMRRPEFFGVESIKAVFPFRRKAGMTVADFQRYWWAQHGPLAACTQDALCYLQCHVLPACYEGESPPFDGITELHWRDVAAAQAAMASRQMTRDQREDSTRFADGDSVVIFLAWEEVVVEA